MGGTKPPWRWISNSTFGLIINAATPSDDLTRLTTEIQTKEVLLQCERSLVSYVLFFSLSPFSLWSRAAVPQPAQPKCPTLPRWSPSPRVRLPSLSEGSEPYR